MPDATHRVLPQYFVAYDASTRARSVLEVGTSLRRLGLRQVTTYDCAGTWCCTIGTYEVLDGPSAGVVITVAHGSVHDWDGPLIEDHPGLKRVEAGVTTPPRP